jgi:hypothetical protein
LVFLSRKAKKEYALYILQNIYWREIIDEMKAHSIITRQCSNK